MLDQMHARRRRHAVNHQRMNAPGRLRHSQAKWLSDPAHGAHRRLQVQAHRATQEKAGVVVTEQQAGIGDCGFCAALAIAGRARS